MRQRKSWWVFAHAACADVAREVGYLKAEPEVFPIIYPTTCAFCAEPMDHHTFDVVRWRRLGSV